MTHRPPPQPIQLSPSSPTHPLPIPMSISPPTPAPIAMDDGPMNMTQRRRPSLALVDVDGPGALAPLTETPSIGQVMSHLLNQASTSFGTAPRSNSRASKHSLDEDHHEHGGHNSSSASETDGETPSHPGLLRTDSLLVKLFKDTLRRFTPEPTDLEGVPEEDFDREASFHSSTSPRNTPKLSPSIHPVPAIDLSSPPNIEGQLGQQAEEHHDHEHLELPPSLPPNRGRRMSWVQLAADTVINAILPKDAFDIELSTSLKTEKKFLGSYTTEDLKTYLVDFGIKEELAKRGYKDLLFKIDTSDPFVQRLTVTDTSLLDQDQKEKGAKIVITASNFIMDMWIRVKDMRYHDFHAYQELIRLKEGDPGFLFKHTGGSGPGGSHRSDGLPVGATLQTHHISICDIPVEEAAIDVALFEKSFSEPPLSISIVDWLEIQNPHSQFTKTRPPLPGQRNPGLKVARKVVSLILSLAEWKHRDCLSNTPDNWHNAYMYGRRGFQYVDPFMQGYIMAIEEALDGDIVKYGLGPVAWAWKLGHVKRTDNGKTVIWSSTQEQVYPTSSRMRKFFTSDEYLRQVEKARNFYAGKFMIDFEDLRVQAEIRTAMGWGSLQPTANA